MSLLIRIRGDASSFDRSIRGVSSSIARLGPGIAAIGSAIGATFVASKVIEFGKGASMAASDFEQLEMQFETLTKSGEITADLLQSMKDDAAKSPLSVSDYAQAGKTLLAFGNEAEGIMDTLRQLADVSMGNSERFGSLSLAFAQTTAAGRLMGQEVLQFVNAGFNPLQQISKKTGETMLQLKKRMEDGAVSAAEVKDAFKDATSEGGLFYQAIQKGGETTAGKIAQLKDTVLSLQIAFGEGLNEGVKAGAMAIASGIGKFEDQFASMGIVVGKAIKESFDGEYEGLVKIGMAIMSAIGAGIKAGIEIAIYGIGNEIMKGIENYNPLRKLEIFKDSGKLSGQLQSASPEIMARAMEDAVTSIRDAINSVSAPVGVTPTAQRLFDQGVRAGDPGYGGTEMSKMLETLERIARAVDKPFPN